MKEIQQVFDLNEETQKNREYVLLISGNPYFSRALNKKGPSVETD